ncbi:MAG: hypothetical protein WA254_20800 [Candidatus Sulfotelmatobacter sp.]
MQRCTVTRQGDLFAGLWYPDVTYNPYDDAQHLLAAAMKAGAIKQPARAEVVTGRSRPSKKRA